MVAPRATSTAHKYCREYVKLAGLAQRFFAGVTKEKRSDVARRRNYSFNDLFIDPTVDAEHDNRRHPVHRFTLTLDAQRKYSVSAKVGATLADKSTRWQGWFAEGIQCGVELTEAATGYTCDRFVCFPE